MANPPLIADQPYLGDASKAWETYQNTYQKSPAYRQFITAHSDQKSTPQNIFDVPIMSKATYVQSYPLKSRMVVDWSEVLSIARSSGFSATEPTYWPTFKAIDANKSPQLIAGIFQLQQKSALHLVALSLGSWTGGEELAFRTKRLLSQMPIPSVVCTPGNDYADCIDTINTFKKEFDQII